MTRKPEPGVSVWSCRTNTWATSRFLTIGVLVVVCACVACTSSGSARSPRRGEKLNLTTAQMQIKMRALADPFSGIVEETVWKI